MSAESVHCRRVRPIILRAGSLGLRLCRRADAEFSPYPLRGLSPRSGGHYQNEECRREFYLIITLFSRSLSNASNGQVVNFSRVGAWLNDRWQLITFKLTSHSLVRVRPWYSLHIWLNFHSQSDRCFSTSDTNVPNPLSEWKPRWWPFSDFPSS